MIFLPTNCYQVTKASNLSKFNLKMYLKCNFICLRVTLWSKMVTFTIFLSFTSNIAQKKTDNTYHSYITAMNYELYICS